MSGRESKAAGRREHHGGRGRPEAPFIHLRSHVDQAPPLHAKSSLPCHAALHASAARGVGSEGREPSRDCLTEHATRATELDRFGHFGRRSGRAGTSRISDAGRCGEGPASPVRYVLAGCEGVLGVRDAGGGREEEAKMSLIVDGRESLYTERFVSTTDRHAISVSSSQCFIWLKIFTVKLPTVYHDPRLQMTAALQHPHLVVSPRVSNLGD